MQFKYIKKYALPICALLLVVSAILYYIPTKNLNDLQGNFVGSGGMTGSIVNNYTVVPDGSGNISVPLKIDVTGLTGSSTLQAVQLKMDALPTGVQLQSPVCFTSQNIPNFSYSSNCSQRSFTAYDSTLAGLSNGIHYFGDFKLNVTNFTGTSFNLTFSDTTNNKLTVASNTVNLSSTETIALNISVKPVVTVQNIVGTPEVNKVLQCQYTYSGTYPESGTTFKWLRSATNTGTYTPISGATSSTYTTTSSDGGMFVKCEVTPVDNQNNVGYPVMSPALAIANGLLDPTPLNALAGDTTVQLTWSGDLVDGATHYKIYQKNGTSYGTAIYTLLASTCTQTTVKECSHIVTGLTNGTAYTFAVTSYNNSNEGNKKDFNAVTPQASISINSVTFSPDFLNGEQVYVTTPVTATVNASSSNSSNLQYAFEWKLGTSTLGGTFSTNNTKTLNTNGYFPYNLAYTFSIGQTWELKVTVNDGVATKFETYSFTIQNSLPVVTLASGCSANATQGSQWTCGYTVTDPNNQIPTYTLNFSPLPYGPYSQNNGQSSWQMIWNPTNDDVGIPYTITLQVNDNNGGIVSKTMNVTVLNVNDNPVWETSTISALHNQTKSATEGALYSQNVRVKDVDLAYVGNNENIQYTLVVTDIGGTPLTNNGGAIIKNSTANLNLIKEGIIEWTPDNTHSSKTYRFTVTAKDAAGNSAEHNGMPINLVFDVTVINVNSAPVINESLINADIANGLFKTSQGSTLTLDLNAYESDTDPHDDDAALRWSIDEAATNLNGVQSITNEGASDDMIYVYPEAKFFGTIPITLRLVDSTNTADTYLVNITFTNTDDAPVINNTALAQYIPTGTEDTPLDIVLGNYITDSDFLTQTDLENGITWNFSYDSQKITSISPKAGFGSFTITPEPNFQGQVSISFVVQDNTSLTASSSFTIVFNNINDAPVWDYDYMPSTGNSYSQASVGYEYILNLTQAVQQVDPAYHPILNPTGEKLIFSVTDVNFGTVYSDNNANYFWKFTPTADLAGTQIFPTFSVHDSTNVLAEDVYNATIAIADFATPVASSVVISGTPKLGKTLIGQYTYAGDPEQGSEYQWFVANSDTGSFTPISGANQKTYTVQSSDLGKFIRFTVTPKSVNGISGNAVTSLPIEIPVDVCGQMAGDLNFDGVVDISDEIYALYSLYSYGDNSPAQFTSTVCIDAYDLNNNQSFDIGDWNAIYDIVWGIL